MSMPPLRIAFFGSSLVSAYWNGAATYYRGLLRALHARGHSITFWEPDAYERQQHRDLVEDPPWARVVVYEPTEAAATDALRAARAADLVVKASGVGVLDEFLERAVLELAGPRTLVAFWDVDAPATLERVQQDAADPFARLVPNYDLVFTYGGGDPVVDAYRALGARRCVPIYNAVDPDTHHPVAADAALRGLLGFLGNRLPDREERVREFLFRPAAAMPQHRFLLGGNGWQQDAGAPSNVTLLGHVPTARHNAFFRSPLAALSINRASMVRFGFSPATRVFEAAGAGACLITDAWEGIEQFLQPGRECLVAADGDEVGAHLRALTPERARAIGDAARRRVLAEHTYAHRARLVEETLAAVGDERDTDAAAALAVEAPR